ncbi:MAG: MATE family efflux transporter [Lachnospiraceae bacterium]|nr:MATE family efflux transporter [Lachnospiraceae bacterium]
MTNKSTVQDLTTGSPFRLIILFAIPMILGNLLQQLYNFVDTMIVGQFLGMEALAGVGDTSSINFLILGFCMGVCAGFAVPVAQRFGAKDEAGLKKYFANSLTLSVIISVALAVIVSLLCRNILEWMSTPDDVFEYAYTYILTIFIGIPITFLYNILAGAIRSIGDSKTPLIFLIISLFINVGLDYLFIAAFDWGVFGAALATVLAQLISGIMCVLVIVKKFTILHITKDDCRLDKKCAKLLCAMGIPMGLQYSITAIGSVILQGSVNHLGSLAVAATTVASKVNMIFISILDALGAAMATYAGQNLGAGRIDRIRKGAGASVIIGVTYSVIAFGLALLVRKPMINLFIDKPDPEMVDMAAMHVLITTGALSFLVLVNCLRFMIQGVGYSQFAILAGVLEMVARTFAGLVIIPHFDFIGACVASPSAWVLADMFLVPAFFWVVRKLEKTYNRDAVQQNS